MHRCVATILSLFLGFKGSDAPYSHSKIDREFSEPFLTALSAFGGTIAIVTDRPCDNVKRISPNHPNLIDAVLKWLHRSILEA
ncbi:hypothetical protein QT971_00250 [Microcoleus sp. herbarium19]|uniref:NACHT C-terminal alpha/beta 1 domain-containing protein n=1 Tax=unclassified Microcoleus TaxID=2642155 RepID=UPI002FD0FA9F